MIQASQRRFYITVRRMTSGDELKYLSGYLHGRVRLNATAKKRINETIAEQAGADCFTALGSKRT